MLKNKTITTAKATLLLVEFPEGAEIESELFVNNYGRYIRWWNKGKDYLVDLPDEDGNWQLLGRLPDITEEQADQVVDEYTYNTGEIDGYYDYENDTQIDCPIESLNSLMYTNEICFENKELKWKTFDTKEKYKEAQSKVWDKERTYSLIKVD